MKNITTTALLLALVSSPVSAEGLSESQVKRNFYVLVQCVWEVYPPEKDRHGNTVFLNAEPEAFGKCLKRKGYVYSDNGPEGEKK